MKELKITDKQLHQFKIIIEVYRNTTKYPKPGKWRSLSNTEIWFWMVGQVMVVGSAGGGKRFWENPELQRKIDFRELQQKRTENQIKKAIHSVLRESGARYASSEPEKCAKTKALHFNFMAVNEFKNGFKDLFELLDDMKGQNRELNRVYYLMEHLKFMKNKSARDFLMNLGMNQNTLAIDIRIQNIFQHLRIDFPGQAAFSKNVTYEAIEQDIKMKICKPLGISPLKFDRILYQNYLRIVKNDFYQLKFHFKK